MNKTASIASLGLQRPNKLAWRINTDSCEDYLSCIKSKSVRKFARNIDDRLQKVGLVISEKAIENEADFKEWLKDYTAFAEGKGFDVLSSNEWFQKKIDRKIKIREIRLNQRGKLIGSMLYTILPDFTSSAFRINYPFPDLSKKGESTGAALNILFLREAWKLGKPMISYGLSRNAYGVINTYGNLQQKAMVGALPYLALERTELDNNVPINDQNQALCFAWNNAGVRNVVQISPKGVPFPISVQKYLYIPDPKIITIDPFTGEVWDF